MLSIPVKNFNFLGIHPKTVLLCLRGCVSVSISEKMEMLFIYLTQRIVSETQFKGKCANRAFVISRRNTWHYENFPLFGDVCQANEKTSVQKEKKYINVSASCGILRVVRFTSWVPCPALNQYSCFLVFFLSWMDRSWFRITYIWKIVWLFSINFF